MEKLIFLDERFVSKDIMDKRLENSIKYTFDLIKKDFPLLTVFAYDFWNEVFKVDDGGLRTAEEFKWMQNYGDDTYIVNDFTYERKYAPSGCKLYINDFNEYMDKKTQKLKEKGVIDRIGIQSHLGITFPSDESCIPTLEKFCATGLEVQITAQLKN